jgi:S-DNA-T family DNA segregation ATPase FtsK/SpoIIIE
LSKSVSKRQKNKKEPSESKRSRIDEILREGALIGWLAVCGYLFISLVSFSPKDPGWSNTGSGALVLNSAGPAGAWLADVTFSIFGWMAFLLPVLLILRAGHVFRVRRDEPVPFDWISFTQRVIGFFLVMLSTTALAQLHYGSVVSELPMNVGGVLGSAVGDASVAAFNYIGSTLILLAVVFFGLTIFADISWLALIDKTGEISLRVYEVIRSKLVAYLKKRAEQKQSQQASPKRPEIVATKAKAAEKRMPPSIPIPRPSPEAKQNQRAQKEKQASIFDDAPVKGRLPSISLLDPADPKSKKGFSAESLDHMSRLLELKLQDFGITAEVVDVLPGPVITRFEIQPAPGVKVSRITNLAKDLARSLAVVSVRVVEVIPGKSVIGVEIPNKHREMVHLSEVISSEIYDAAKSPLTLALGNDISGIPTVADLAKMPHLLVAGTTGSGKSVGINAMLVSLLYKSSPDEVRLILVDPKMLELAVYDGIPHLLTPVITDMKDAATGLRWSVGEMERRYKLMAAMGVRNLAGFNRKIKDAIAAGEPIKDPLWQPDPMFDIENQLAPDLETLPYIVIVIDEFADMIMIVGKKVEQLIARIAQKARAAGIHLILATQRPSVDVITGLIKANVPTRIGFQVSSKIDSRTILDQGGAEQLLGHGDMLYLPPGSSVPQRIHGAFVDDHEVHKVVSDWKKRGEPDYMDEILDESLASGIAVPGFASEGEGSNGEKDPESDVLYDEAVEFILKTRRPSISSVQRKLRIGYNRAARLIEAMETAGVVSAMGSNGNREVLAPERRGD